jgi:large subunit ribosomal protein L2
LFNEIFMKTYKPTTASRRNMTGTDYSTLTKGARPWKPLLKRLTSNAGRNSQGRITTRHQGGGNKKMYRMIDFKQGALNSKVLVETIEYDPYRTAFIARVKNADGSRSYILAPEGLKVGAELMTAEVTPSKTGNRMMLKNIPVGHQVYNIEMNPGHGGQLARSAGTYAEVLANAEGYTDLKLNSGEVRRVQWTGLASLGQVSNGEWNLISLGKAGRSGGSASGRPSAAAL